MTWAGLVQCGHHRIRNDDDPFACLRLGRPEGEASAAHFGELADDADGLCFQAHVTALEPRPGATSVGRQITLIPGAWPATGLGRASRDEPGFGQNLLGRDVVIGGRCPEHA